MKLRLIVLISFLSLNCIAALSQIADSWAGGSGTKDDPYKISDISQLRKLANDCNNGESFKNKYFILVNDIVDNHNVLNEDGELSDKYLNSPLWTPIGKSKKTPFRGHFDGNNHVISGIVGCNDITDSEGWFVSLFERLENGSISNLRIKDCYWRSIVGSCISSNIDNCVNYATCIVGIVSEATSGSVISNSGNYGITYLAGVGEGGYRSDVIFRNCYNFGEVRGLKGMSAGIVQFAGKCQNCFNMGKVNGYGGIVRYVFGSENSTLINNVVNYGLVEPFDDDNAGAIASSGGTSGWKNYVQNVYALETSNVRLLGRNSNLRDVGDNLRMTEGEMKSKELLDKLNANARKMGNGCCGWKFGKNGLPVLDIVDDEESAGDHLIEQIADTWKEGSGTEEDPYKISDISHLRRLAYDCNRGVSFKNKYFVLVNDIVDNYNVIDGEGELSKEYWSSPLWTPIGKTMRIPFMGHLDGKNHTISGFVGARDLTNDDEECNSLFGYVKEGSVSNLKIKDSYWKSLINYCETSVIDNCVNYATCVAGIVYEAISTGSVISNCGNYGLCYLAGISGGAALRSKDVLFRNCYNYGEINACWDDDSGAGIAGRAGRCENCFNMGTIKGNAPVGGIIGYAWDVNGSTVISNVVNYGLVEPFDDDNVGAISPDVEDYGITNYVHNVYALETSNIRLLGSQCHGNYVGDHLRMTEDEMKSKEFLDKLNENAAKLGNGCCGWKFGKDGFPVLEIVELNEDAAVGQIDVFSGEENNDNNVIYYNLQGIRINVPVHGFYLKVCGNSVEKIYIP